MASRQIIAFVILAVVVLLVAIVVWRVRAQAKEEQRRMRGVPPRNRRGRG